MEKAADIIYYYYKKKKISQSQLARCMGEDVRKINQQLKRQKDIKFERFVDIMEHLGYRVEIIENNGIRKISKKYAKSVIENKEPKGLFWEFSNGLYTGINNLEGNVLIESFGSQQECFKWLNGEKCIDANGIIHNK